MARIAGDPPVNVEWLVTIGLDNCLDLGTVSTLGPHYWGSHSSWKCPAIPLAAL